MAKISLNKRIEATKLHERTGAPLAGPEVSIPFGALVESVGSERDREKFRFLGELYSVRQDIFIAATKADEVEATATHRAARVPDAPAALAEPPKLLFEYLDAGAWEVARAKVPGGWLVSSGSGIAFYPDPGHEWDGTSVQ